MLGEFGGRIVRAFVRTDPLGLSGETVEQIEESVLGLRGGGGAIEARWLTDRNEHAVMPAYADCLAARAVVVFADDQLAQVRVRLFAFGCVGGLEIQPRANAIVPTGRARE